MNFLILFQKNGQRYNLLTILQQIHNFTKTIYLLCIQNIFFFLNFQIDEDSIEDLGDQKR